MRTACVFYDLIPIKNAAYAGGRALHEAYVAELTRCDLVLPISVDSGVQLTDLWRERGVSPTPPIVPLILPDGGFASLAKSPPKRAGAKSTIALIGTVEPRKRQIEFLGAMQAARQLSREVAKREVVVLGSLHPYVAEAFNAFIARHPWVRYLDYASEADLHSAFRNADFTAFVSEDEGYGLPISESLALGTPCLCANFGSMAEIAENGGCYTVDVRDGAALQAAVIELCEMPQRLRRLREEIVARPFQRWEDYARGVLARMAAVPRAEIDLAVVWVRAPIGSPTSLDERAFADLAEADILSFPEKGARSEFVLEAARRGWPALLPGRQPLQGASNDDVCVQRGRAERERIAGVERVYAKARATIPPDIQTRPIFLRILISTLNRHDFVLANVRWLLKEVIGPVGAGVDLLVVDGGSTDATVRALRRIADPRLTVIESPVNVGMLGGIREAVRHRGAEYVWVIGDDDFIRPDGFRAMLAGLRRVVGVPLAFTNFSVYHRAALSSADRPADLIAEARPIADQVASDGLITVRKAAEQTDNLFTAIYGILWRADVLSAAYDHAFDGAPFSDLIEAIPCTELILRSFGTCDAWWHGKPAIAGNAHNSWSQWRPRWHGVVMPKAFALAREVGVDARRLQVWADLHLGLFREAMAIARDRGYDHELSFSDLDLAHLMFRTDIAREI